MRTITRQDRIVVLVVLAQHDEDERIYAESLRLTPSFPASLALFSYVSSNGPAHTRNA